MVLALWDEPSNDLFDYGRARQEDSGIEIVRIPKYRCEAALLSGEVDAALLPTTGLLFHAERFDALPAVALSSWRYPPAELLLAGGLDRPVAKVAFDPNYPLERLVAEIVLTEQYKHAPTFVPVDVRDAIMEELSGYDGVVSARDAGKGLYDWTQRLDLGEEWYELAGYPFTWGLFAMRKGEAEADHIRILRDSLSRVEHMREEVAANATERYQSFFREDVRIRLDDLAVAGLTELRQYLYFMKYLEDVAEIPFVPIEDDSDEGEDLIRWS